MKTQNTYRNPWQKGAKNGSPAIYQNNAPCVFEYRGVKVFKLNESSFDYVLGDCAIAQRAGASKAKEVIDGILGRDPGMYICEAVLTHLAAHGIEVLKKPIHGEDIQTMKKHPISSDKRYTVQKEFCGHKDARFVARFVGEWIGQSVSYSSAVMLATGHRLIRQGAPVFINQPA